MMHGFFAVVKKEFTHLVRDRASLMLAIFLPVFQVCMYGYAIDFDVRHIPAVLVDLDRSPESRLLIQQLEGSQYLDISFQADSSEEAAAMVRSGKAHVAVIVPPDFSRKVNSKSRPQIGVLVDGSDSQVALRAQTAFRRPSTSAADVDARVNVLFNPNSRAAVYMIPGLIGLILQLVLTSLTSGSIVREREQGSLEQLMVTPVTKTALLLGKLFPFLILALGEMALILSLGYVLFDVKPAGSVVLLFLVSFPFVLASLGVGLFISAASKTQAQALQLSTFFFIPQILLSGFIFPRETMPGILQLIGNLLPLTHQLQILRAIVVRGADFADIWTSVVATSILAVLWLSLAASRFSKTMV